jgi:rhodanese-related sulfurtransferase
VVVMANRDRSLERLLARARSRLARLRPRQALEAMKNGAFLIDIRPGFQRHADGEVPGAIVIERNHLEWRLHPGSSARIPEAADRAIRWIVICDEGYASSLAAATLQEVGLSNATDVIGGFKAWRAAKLPVVTPAVATWPRLAPRRLRTTRKRARRRASK